MNSPYTSNFADAYTIAQTTLGAVLTAFVWRRPPKRAPVTVPFLVVGIWLASLFSVEPALLASFRVTTAPTHAITLLHLSALFIVVAGIVASPVRVGVFSALGWAFVHWVTSYVTSSDPELAALHSAFAGFVIGLCWRQSDQDERTDLYAPLADHRRRTHDIAIFIAATAIATFVCVFVLQRGVDSADEWSNTFQAYLFAHFRAWSKKPECFTAFRNFWIFWVDDRLFSQYTPGWPLFMAPFARFDVPWLAGPFSLGLLAVGVARVARRATAAIHQGTIGAPNDREISIAGIAAAGMAMVSSTLLINGGSRFPHVFVCATFAWCIDLSCAVTSDGLSTRRQWTHGSALGLSAIFLLSSRPVDGALLGVPLFLYVAYSAARGRLPLRSAVSAVGAFGLVAFLVLAILHAQLGRWFVGGYSLTETMHPFAKVTFSVPKSDQWRYSFPLATGAYCWWPLAPALGILGLITFRRGARSIFFILFVGTTLLLGFYSALAFGRGVDFGYGPRYQLPSVVAMAVGSSVVVARLLRRGESQRAGAAWRGGPATLALGAMLFGTMRLVPLVYPNNFEDVRLRNMVDVEIKRMNLRQALVLIPPRVGISDTLDLTHNLPFEVRPIPDAVIVRAVDTESTACVRSMYPYRKAYMAQGSPEVTLVPVP